MVGAGVRVLSFFPFYFFSGRPLRETLRAQPHLFLLKREREKKKRKKKAGC